MSAVQTACLESA